MLAAVRGVVLAGLALALLAAPAHAAEEQVNTWNGECRDVPGSALWHEQPMRLVPAEIPLVAFLDGGLCTGTLNGEQVTDVPLVAELEMSGIQSCAGADITGRAEWTVGGVPFTGSVHYRRAGVPAVVDWRGDAGGQVLAFLRGTTSANDEFDQQAFEDFVRGCAGDGVTEAFFRVVRGVTTETIASPAPDEEQRSRSRRR